MKQKQLSRKQQKKKQFKQLEQLTGTVQQEEKEEKENLEIINEIQKEKEIIQVEDEKITNKQFKHNFTNNVEIFSQLPPCINKERLLQNLNCRRIIICGEKDSGKSTTCLHLCNILLEPQYLIQEKIFLLDTDLGQPFEWGLPGFITLYEITEAYPSVPKKIYQGFVGEFSTMNHFDLYFNHIKNIIEICNQSKLIVNTQGFIQSFGGVVLQYLLQIIQPDKVFILNPQQKPQEQAQKLKTKLESQKILFKLIPNTHLDTSQQKKPEIEILSETPQDNSKQNLIYKLNTQHRKRRREEKLLTGLGINIKQSKNFLKDLNGLPVQTLKFDKLKFFTLPYSIELNSKLEATTVQSIMEVGQQFIMNLVCIADQNENENIFCDNLQKISINSQCIGMIKDVDLDSETVDIICQKDLSKNDYIIIKSQFFELGRETLALSVSDLLEFSDHQHLVQGLKIDTKFNIPYVFPSVKAIGMSSLKIGINKKIQKKKV